jgi:hypothetical protein
MPAEDVKALIVERVRARAEERHLPVVAAAEITGDGTIGEGDDVAKALHELILAGELRAVLAGGGVFVAVATEREKRRRAALAPLTRRVLVDMAGKGQPLENLLDAIRIVDALEK